MRRMLVAVLGVSVAVSGCSAAYLAAKKGQDALDRGDVEEALGHYFSACRQSDDADWCARANRLHGELKGAVIADATPLCGRPGDEQQCLATLKRLRRFKDDAELAALADAAGTSWLEKCRAPQVLTPVDAVARVRCVETLHAEMMTERYDDAVRTERQTMAHFVAKESRVVASQGFVVAGYGLAELARCFSRTEPVSLDAARKQALERLTVRTAVAADGVASQGWVCSRLSEASDGRLSCAADGAAIGLRVSVQRSELAHTFRDSAQDVSYVAERRQYDNPDWLRLDGLRERETHRERKARHQARLASDECEVAKREHTAAKSCTQCEAESIAQRACTHAESLAGFAREAKRDLDDVEWRLQQTDRFLIQEITAVYRSVERAHLWQQRFQVSLAASGTAAQGATFSLDVSRSGVDREPFEPAGIEGSVAVVPTQSGLDAEALGDVKEALTRWTRDAQAATARQREAECASRDGELAKLECGAGVAFLQGQDVANAYAAALGKEVDRVASYPAAACAR